MNNRLWCNGGVNCTVSPWEHQGAALQGQGRSIVPPAYQSLVVTHPSIQSSAGRASQELGLGASAGKAVPGQSESSVLGSRQGQGSTRQCSGAWQRPPRQGLH